MKKKRTTSGKRARNGRTQDENRRAFLDAYKKCGVIKHAARAVGIVHGNHYRWLVHTPGYAAEFATAHAEAVENLAPKAEAELIDRAIYGERTLVIDKGQAVEVWVNPAGEIVPSPADPANPGDLKKTLYWEVKKSDGLLQFLLKNLMPEKYGDKAKVSLSGADGGPVQTETAHKFDHAHFAELYRSRTRRAGDGAGAAAADRN